MKGSVADHACDKRQPTFSSMVSMRDDGGPFTESMDLSGDGLIVEGNQLGWKYARKNQAGGIEPECLSNMHMNGVTVTSQMEGNGRNRIRKVQQENNW